MLGVVVLHLLLIPGTAFLAGGAQIWEQNLHPHPTQLNHSLLAAGCVHTAHFIPVTCVTDVMQRAHDLAPHRVFCGSRPWRDDDQCYRCARVRWYAGYRPDTRPNSAHEQRFSGSPAHRVCSRRFTAILRLTSARYIGSRIFLHNPPGDDNAVKVAPNAPLAYHKEEHHLIVVDPEINPWACMILLVITIALMATTAEFVSAFRRSFTSNA